MSARTAGVVRALGWIACISASSGGGVVCSLEAPGKRQACSSVAQRASSQQCSATKQPNWAHGRALEMAPLPLLSFRVSSGNQPRLIVRARMLLPFALPKPDDPPPAAYRPRIKSSNRPGFSTL